MSTLHNDKLRAAVGAAMGKAMHDPAKVRAAERAIGDARTTLMLDAPFYGAIALRLTLVANARIAQGTAATDGHSLFYNPDWILTLTPRQLVGLIAHEVMHIAMKHTLRREGRNPRDWNIACDHAINNDLTGERFELPDDGFCDRRFKGWAAEEIFPHVARPPKPQGQPQPQPQGGGAGEGQSTGASAGGDDDDDSEREPQSDDDAPDGDGDDTDTDDGDTGDGDSDTDDGDGDGEGTASGAGGGGDDDDETLPAGGVLDSPDPVADEAEIDIALVEAGMCAKAAGNLPGHLARLINASTRARVDWKSLLADFLQRNMRDDFSMSRPSRRYLSAGVYLPSLHSEATPEIALFVDTSGSINERQLSVAVNAINDCIAEVVPERVHFMACDTRVHQRATFERGERIEVNTDGGGGGTWFAPPFDALAADGVEPVCALYFTADACGSFGDEPSYPVLWIVERGASTPPWGQVVQLDDIREVSP